MNKVARVNCTTGVTLIENMTSSEETQRAKDEAAYAARLIKDAADAKVRADAIAAIKADPALSVVARALGL